MNKKEIGNVDFGKCLIEKAIYVIILKSLLEYIVLKYVRNVLLILKSTIIIEFYSIYILYYPSYEQV